MAKPNSGRCLLDFFGSRSRESWKWLRYGTPTCGPAFSFTPGGVVCRLMQAVPDMHSPHPLAPATTNVCAITIAKKVHLDPPPHPSRVSSSRPRRKLTRSEPPVPRSSPLSPMRGDECVWLRMLGGDSLPEGDAAKEGDKNEESRVHTPPLVKDEPLLMVMGGVAAAAPALCSTAALGVLR